MTDTIRFQDLNLSKATLNAITAKGFEEPTPVQMQSIPFLLNETRDLIAQAQTGTGKTAAFGLPLVDLVDANINQIQALILAPTRELALQVSEEMHSFRGESELRTLPVYGGQSIDQQLRRLKKGVHIVVGTPGRIIDHIKRGSLKLSHIRYLILDEADEMLSMGFIEDMEYIMSHTPRDKRTFLFSATMPKGVQKLAQRYMPEHHQITIKKEQLTSNLTEQIYFEVQESDKFEALCRILDMEEAFYGLIFCRTKKDVDALTSHLNSRGYDAGCVHGDISQNLREKMFQRFRKQDITILIATDVAARGIDIDNLSHVINYSLPQDPESYVHRIGRTGRAGNSGTAITFITPREYKQLMFIQRIAKTDIKKSKVPEVQELIQAKKKKFQDDIQRYLESTQELRYTNWAEELLSQHPPHKIISALLNYTFDDALNPNLYKDVKDVSSSKKSVDTKGKTRLFVALGKKDNLTPNKLLKKITSQSNVPIKQIRDIQILDSFSFVTVPFDLAETIVASFKTKGKAPLITHAKKKASRDKT